MSVNVEPPVTSKNEKYYYKAYIWKLKYKKKYCQIVNNGYKCLHLKYNR